MRYIKKGSEHLLQERWQKYEFVKKFRGEFSTGKMCSMLKIPRSAYYKWVNREPSARDEENNRLREKIQAVYDESKGRYGSPKITRELHKAGMQASRPRVARIMKKAGLRSAVRKKYKVCTTDSNHSHPVAENHLHRDFSASEPGQKWVSDITYISTAQGWLYLTTIIDLFDRKVVGWAMSDGMTASETTVAAWNMAVGNRKYIPGLIFHSDRGVQYACKEFSGKLGKLSVVQSMSRKGNCWDNAVAENFFKILKSEMVQHSKYQTKEQAKLEIFEFIESWYNRKRIHSYLDYMTPEEFSNLYYSNAA